MPSTWGTMAVSSPERRLQSQAACSVDLRKERWPPLPSPILVAACHTQTMNSNKRDRPKKAIRGPEKGPNPWELSHMRPPSESSVTGSGHRNPCVALGGGMNRSSGAAS